MSTITIDLFEALQPDLDRVDDRLAKAASLPIPEVTALVQDIVSAGGKRLRPLLLLLSGRAFRYDRETLVTAAAGVELLHTASLVHDDSIDRAAIRRGRPTLNSRLGSGAVILIGDYLFAQSAILAAATDQTRVVAVFASTLADICDGQIREMFNAHRLDQTLEEYESRIYGKTASLFAASTEMGAIIGGASEHDISVLRNFGRDIGMAYQIIDDILDLRESTADLGKPAGNDLRQGTVTLPVMMYAERLPPESAAARRLRDVVTGALDLQADLDAVVLDIRESGAIDQATQVAESYIERAKRRLDVVADPENRQMLVDVADFVLRRSN